MKFSTFDKDQDTYSGDCAAGWRSGFWFRDCMWTNLNGLYGNKDVTHPDYVTWYDFRGYDALKWVEMKFRPNY